MHLGTLGAAVLTVGLCAVSVAHGQSAATETPGVEPSDKPWARGVSAGDQSAALAAFQQGNQYFAERRYTEAIAHYRQAVTHWKHPAIHFNIAVCMVHMDQPIEALHHINEALAFDQAPLGEQLYAEGMTYQKLLTDRLGHLTVAASQAGAEITLDGQPLLVSPGSETRVLMPGRHQIVATLSGHLTHTQNLDLVAGEPMEVEVTMIPLDQATEFEHPIATWVPWVTMGSGVLVGLAGLGVRAIAGAKLDAYDRGVIAECPTGCAASTLSDGVRAEKSTGEMLDVVSLITMGVGAATLLTGVTLLLLNQPRPVERVEAGVPTVRASVSPHHAQLQVGFAL